MHATSRPGILPLSVLAGLSISAALLVPRPRPHSAAVVPMGKRQLAASYARLPLSFELNEGQADGQVKFLAGARGQRLYLTDDGAVLSLSRAHRSGSGQGKSHKTDRDTAQVRMRLAGSNRQAKVEGLDLLPGRVNYLKGRDKSQWRTNVKTYGKVRYAGVYPGVDVVYYGNQSQLEYDLVVKPGQNPGVVKLSFNDLQERPTAAQIAKDGSLVLHTATGDVQQHRPVVYQKVAGKRQLVKGRYVQLAKNEIGFSIGGYDRGRPLVIDPVISYSTYLGGAADDEANGIAVDSSGNVYVAGKTFSDPFKTQSPLPGHAALDGNSDAFVTKLNAAGTALAYSTYLGGAGDDAGNALALDNQNRVWITGRTNSADFPGAANALAGGDDAFITCLSADGSLLDFSTYVGGPQDDSGEGIALDSSGNVFACGVTQGIGGAIRIGPGGGHDGFVARLNTNLTLGYVAEIGGADDDGFAGVAVAGSNVYLAGASDSGNYPTAHGPQTTLANPPGQFLSDVTLTVLNAPDASLLASTYLGGEGDDAGAGVAVDAGGAIYVAGRSGSPNLTFTGGKQTSYAGGNYDAFLAKYTLDGTGLHAGYGTFLGGSADDAATAVVVDGAGVAYLTGSTNSTNFPLQGALDNRITGVNDPKAGYPTDVFVAKVNTNATGAASLAFSTFLGGAGEDEGRGIATDGTSIWVAGVTQSSDFPNTAALFPAISGVINPDFGTYPEDAFILKLGTPTGPPPPPAPTGLHATLNGVSVALTWTYTGPKATYTLYRSVGGGAFNLLRAKVTKTAYGANVADSLGAADTAVAYRVTATVGTSESGPSDPASVTLLGSPANLTLTQVTNTANVTVAFTNNSAAATGFKLRLIAGRKVTDVATFTGNSGPGARSLTWDSSNSPLIKDGTAATYQLVAFNSETTSAPSNTVSFTRTPAPPPPPSGLKAALSGATVTLTWTSSTAKATFNVYRKGQKITASAVKAGSYSDDVTSLLPGSGGDASVSYYVTAVVSAAESGPSDPAAVTLLGAPTNLALSQVAGTNNVTVTFTNNSAAATGFKLQQVAGSKIADVVTFTGNSGPGAMSQTWDSSSSSLVTDDTAATYQVVAFNSSTASKGSNQVSFTRMAVPPAAPTDLTFTLVNGLFTLRWMDNSLNEAGFYPYFAVGGTFQNTFLPIPSGPGTGPRTFSFAPSTEVEFSIKLDAYRGNAESGFTNTITAIAAAPPSFLNALAFAGKRIHMSFGDNSNVETGFEVLRTDSRGQALVTTLPPHPSVGRLSVDVTDSDAVVGTKATYSVRAITGSGSSAVATAQPVKILP